MRVFRPTRKDKSGKMVPYAKWYVEFRDHLDVIRRLPAFTDKKQSEELGRKIDKLAACRANHDTPDKQMGRWLESLPARLRDGLAKIGLLDARNVAAGKALTKHLDDFEQSLLAKGNTAKHAHLVANRARRVTAGCRFRLWSNLSASKVQSYLAGLRNNGEGISAQTSNFYLQAIKQFCRWMVRDGRASQSPLDHLQGRNVQTDRRHDRRALSVEETRWLLAVTEKSVDRRGIGGSERALIYRLALESGLRVNEIRSLRKSSFDFQSEPATVTVAAGYSKRRRQDVIPLRCELVDRLRNHLATKLPEVLAFTLPKKDRVAHVLRSDLAEAREAWLQDAPAPAERAKREASAFLAYRDENGLVADFHALRHTFISNLANSGVHPKVAQLLARHSTITLTMDRYTHSMWDDLGEALSALPNLSATALQRANATGTDGKTGLPTGAGKSVALCVAHRGAKRDHSRQREAVVTGPVTSSEKLQKPAQISRKTQEKQSGSAWESNPPTTRLTRRPDGFEDRGRHQSCKHFRGNFLFYPGLVWHAIAASIG